jgi:hypothetical protein
VAFTVEDAVVFDSAITLGFLVLKV